MVSVDVSKLGYISLIFVDPEVKVNGAYYRDVLLSQQLLPAICQVSGEFFIVQQESAPARRACETINLLQRETPAFISPDLCRLTTPITIQLTTKSGASASLDKSAQDVDDSRKRLIDVWTGIQQSVIYDAIK